MIASGLLTQAWAEHGCGRMDVERIIREIHRRSLWQVLAIYLGASWFVLQVAEHVVKQFGLAQWTYGVALLLLLIGLPIVLATAFVQEGPPRVDHDWESQPGTETHPRGHGAASYSLFTWRNALAGAVGAAALWGVVAAGWLLVAPGRGEETGASRLAQITAAEGDVELADEGTPGGPATRRDQDVESIAGAKREAHPSRGGQPAGTADPPSPHRTGTATPTEPRDGRSPERSARDLDQREYAELLEMTTRTAERAQEAGAVERGIDLSSPDSLLSEARAAAGGGDLRRAQRDLASARALYDDAARRAEAAWRTAADSAARAVDSLRAKARPSAEGYREGESRRRQAATAADGGDYRLAVDLLRGAATDYERARETPAEPAAGRDAVGDGDAPETAIREVVTEVLARLERALESEDLEALGRVWVTMDPASADGFQRFFDRIRDFDVQIEIRWETLVASESRLTVTGVTTWSYYDERLRRRATREPFEQAFELVRRDAEWVVIRY